MKHSHKVEFSLDRSEIDEAIAEYVKKKLNASDGVCFGEINYTLAYKGQEPYDKQVVSGLKGYYTMGTDSDI